MDAEGILESIKKVRGYKEPKPKVTTKVTKSKFAKEELPPISITSADKNQLKNLGWTSRQIKKMKVEDVKQIIQRREPGPLVIKIPKGPEEKVIAAMEAKAKVIEGGKVKYKPWHEYSKEIRKAIGEDIKGAGTGIVADPHRNLRQFLKENKLKLSEAEIARIHNFAKNLPKTVAKANQEAEFQKYISKNFPKLGTEPIVIPTKPLGKVDIKDISQSKYLNMREKIQDAQIRIRKLQESPGVKVTEAGNRYDAEVRFHGRVSGKLEKMQDNLTHIDKDILGTAKKIGVQEEELTKKVYTYLIAKHTPERNAALNLEKATGLTTPQANEIVSTIEKLPEFKEIQRISDEIQTLNKQTLDILLEGQVIDEGLHTLLRTKYKNHVPLQRILDDVSDDAIGEILNGGKGFMVRGTGLKRAKGSDLEIADLLENVAGNVTQATIRAEKNLVNLSTLEFARNNPGLGLFREIKPKVIGKTFGSKKLGIEPRPIYEKLDTSPASNILALRENGKPVYLKITDPVFAEAYKAVGVDQVPKYLRYVNSFSRFISGLATRFNPEFPIPNILRDTQEMAAYLASQKGFGLRKTAKAISKEPSSIKDVASAVWGKGDTPGAKLYKQMVADGGTTGGMALSTKKQIEVSLSNIRKLNRSRPRMAAHKVLEHVDNLNAVFEDATRLAAYKQALLNKMSREQAAVIAKEATINFNRKGKFGPVINALWIFSNASMQGSMKMLKAMKRPKVAAAVLSSVGGATFAVNRWNDSVDPDWRNKVSDWDRMNGLPVVLNTDEGIDYITIPVSWGIKPMKVLFDTGYDMANGIDTGSAKRIASKVSSSVLDAYNPVGGTSFMQAVAPTFIDLPYDIATNTAWHGGQIKPKESRGFENLPESMRYFDSLTKTQTGKTAIGVAKVLHDNMAIDISPADMIYAIEHYAGGTGRFASRTLNTVIEIGKGESPESRTVPVVNRFYKSVPKEKLDKIEQYREGKNEFFEGLKERTAVDNANRRRKANDTIEKIEGITDSDQKKRIIADLYNNDPRTYETFIRYVKYKIKGLDYIERQVVELQPSDRAKWVRSELDKIDSLKEKQKKVIEWKNKNIINKDVLIELVKTGYKLQ
jgi:hypothetical protein